MCGPYECLIFEKGFISRLKRDRLTLVWASLWGPLLLLWILYAAVQLRNLATALEDQSFQVQPKLKDPIPLPAWTVCGNEGSSIESITCTMDKSSTPILYKKYGDGCFGFNDLKQNLQASFNKGNILCVISFGGSGQAGRVFLHDPIYSADIHDPKAGETIYDILKRIPSGICTAGLDVGTQTSLWWRRNVFEFLNDGNVVGYDKVDAFSEPNVNAVNSTAALLRLEVGDYYEWRYKEVQWWSGYDFWYFMGLMGGMSFFLVLVHSCFFYPLKRLFVALTPADQYTDVGEGSSSRLSVTREPLTSSATSSSTSSSTTFL